MKLKRQMVSTNYYCVFCILVKHTEEPGRGKSTQGMNREFGGKRHAEIKYSNMEIYNQQNLTIYCLNEVRAK